MNRYNFSWTGYETVYYLTMKSLLELRILLRLQLQIPVLTNFKVIFELRATFDWLLPQLAPFLTKPEGVKVKRQTDSEKQLLAVLWLLGTQDSYRSVGNRFDMSKSTLFASFGRCIAALNSITPNIITWPTRQQRQLIKHQFRQMANLRGVVGAIDGTYIKIKAPIENPEVNINRKCFHGVTLQAICLSTLAFTDCFVGYPSSVSDVRVFSNSDIYTEFVNNNGNYFEVDEHIIGDKAYPLHNWCIPPFIDRGRLRERQISFNTAHAQTRRVIERAFALLFGRFRRLRDLDMNRIDLIPATIIAACTLHNICLMREDELIIQYVNEGRAHVDNEEQVVQIPAPEPIPEQILLRAVAMQKRDQLSIEVHERRNLN
ncbi:hypothetical protein NQ315_016229 [Exocentrus adspersus]|uniref:DDE Tnp4 domain-containing protein n=1 Tax=Exocentrus adspersus TaxID=1586481 RepID=A0AAV8VJT2_9CUCU|nr:hypothetical protein NQ315_016229 [Exocentrus adspersus]